MVYRWHKWQLIGSYRLRSHVIMNCCCFASCGLGSIKEVCNVSNTCLNFFKFLIFVIYPLHIFKLFMCNCCVILSSGIVWMKKLISLLVLVVVIYKFWRCWCDVKYYFESPTCQLICPIVSWSINTSMSLHWIWIAVSKDLVVVCVAICCWSEHKSS